MVSIFPPNFGLTTIFNVSENVIFEIIEHGYSETFYNKAQKTLSDYKGSLGIDEDKLSFITRLKKRCNEINKEGDKTVYFDDEVDKTIYFLEDIVKQKEHYFIDYIEKGRRLKKAKSKNYLTHKQSSLTYTPFGAFNSRENKSFIKPSGLLYFDVDIDLELQDKKKLITFFLDDQYIKASWQSFSGKGFGFVVRADWSTEHEMKKAYYKLIEYFQLSLNDKYGINKRIFDTQVCSLSRMNFISYGMIENKKTSTVYQYKDYSDELFNLLHNTYKKDSTLPLLDRELTKKDIKIIQPVKIDESRKTYLKNDEQQRKFIEIITKTLNFCGNDDFNGTIKNYIGRVFRYKIDENIVEDFLFSKIPYNKGSEINFKRLWKCYSNYSQYQTLDPYLIDKK